MSTLTTGPTDADTGTQAEKQGRELALQTLFKNLPKVDLHLHLDGSLFPHFIDSRAKALNIDLPTTADKIRSHLIASKKDAPHQEPGMNWNAFDFCNNFLQTAEELSVATRNVLDFMVQEHNVRVLEIRFCPALHTLRGLSEDAAVSAVTGAYNDYISGTLHPLRGGVILCALRSMGAVHARKTFELAARWLGRGVIGADVAGDEGRFPLQELEAPLRAAVTAGVPLTVHAGEWVANGGENVALAVEIGARRLGHGLVLGDKPELRELVRTRGVVVETCITSNCAHPDRVSDGAYKQHPVSTMIREGVKVAGFNCDNLLLSGSLADQPDPTAEIARAVLRCGLSFGEVRDVLMNGVRASFAVGDSGDDRAFIKQFEQDVNDEISKFTQLHENSSKEENFAV